MVMENPPFKKGDLVTLAPRYASHERYGEMFTLADEPYNSMGHWFAQSDRWGLLALEAFQLASGPW